MVIYNVDHQINLYFKTCRLQYLLPVKMLNGFTPRIYCTSKAKTHSRIEPCQINQTPKPPPHSALFIFQTSWTETWKHSSLDATNTHSSKSWPQGFYGMYRNTVKLYLLVSWWSQVELVQHVVLHFVGAW